MKYTYGYLNGVWIVGYETKFGTIERSIKEFETPDEAKHFADHLNEGEWK